MVHKGVTEEDFAVADVANELDDVQVITNPFLGLKK